MIETLLFFIGLAFLAWLGLIGLVVAMYALRIVLEIIAPVFMVAVDIAIWLKRRISRFLQRPVSPPCF